MEANTLGNLLILLGWANLPGAQEAAAFFHGAEMTGPHPVVDSKDGYVFVSCGGDALFSFNRTDRLKGCAYVVLDDSDYIHWQWKRAQGKDFTEIGQCPNKFLRVVASI